MEKVLYGKLAKKLPIEEGITPKGNNWKKMQFLLEEEGDYKNQIIITLLNNKVDLLKHFKLGDNISVYYNIQCREYKGKYYTDIQAWQIRSYSSNISAKETFEQITNESQKDYSDQIPF